MSPHTRSAPRARRLVGAVAVALLGAALTWSAPAADAAAPAAPRLVAAEDAYTVIVTRPGQDIPLVPSPLANDTGSNLRIVGLAGVPGEVFGYGGDAYSFEVPWQPVAGRFAASYAISDGTNTAYGVIDFDIQVRPPAVPPAGALGARVLSVATDGGAGTVVFSVRNVPDLLHRGASYAVAVDGRPLGRTESVTDGATTAASTVRLFAGSYELCATGSDGSAPGCQRVDVGRATGVDPPHGVVGAATAVTPAPAAAPAAPAVPREDPVATSSAAPSTPTAAEAPAVPTAAAPSAAPTGADWAHGAPSSRQLRDQELAGWHGATARGPVSMDGEQPASPAPVYVVVVGVVLLLAAAANGAVRRRRRP